MGRGAGGTAGEIAALAARYEPWELDEQNPSSPGLSARLTRFWACTADSTGNLFTCVGQLGGGLVISFAYKWDIALVSLVVACSTYLPAMLTMMSTTNKRTKLLAEAYGAAGGIAAEVLGEPASATAHRRWRWRWRSFGVVGG